MEEWKKQEVEKHADHHLEMVKYADGKVFIECIDCNEVLFQINDYDR